MLYGAYLEHVFIKYLKKTRSIKLELRTLRDRSCDELKGKGFAVASISKSGIDKVTPLGDGILFIPLTSNYPCIDLFFLKVHRVDVPTLYAIQMSIDSNPVKHLEDSAKYMSPSNKYKQMWDEYIRATPAVGKSREIAYHLVYVGAEHHIQEIAKKYEKLEVPPQFADWSSVSLCSLKGNEKIYNFFELPWDLRPKKTGKGSLRGSPDSKPGPSKRLSSPGTSPSMGKARKLEIP